MGGITVGPDQSSEAKEAKWWTSSESSVRGKQQKEANLSISKVGPRARSGGRGRRGGRSSEVSNRFWRTIDKAPVKSGRVSEIAMQPLATAAKPLESMENVNRSCACSSESQELTDWIGVGRKLENAEEVV